MTGDMLYPLTILKTKIPNVYTRENKKYAWRKGIKKVKIPILNCLWNDVIFLTAIHPKDLRFAFSCAQVPLKKRRWFKIPLSRLTQKKMVINFYDDKANLQYKPFNKKDIKFLSTPSSLAIDYYRWAFHDFKKRPLNFQYHPHVFYNGSIDISDCQIIEC